MTKKEAYIFFNLNKAMECLNSEEQEILLWILVYDHKKYEMIKHFNISPTTLIKRIKIMKEKLYNEALKGYEE